MGHTGEGLVHSTQPFTQLNNWKIINGTGHQMGSPNTFHSQHITLIQQLGCFVFGVRPAYNFPAWLSALLLIVVSGLAVCWLSWRIRKAEARA